MVVVRNESDAEIVANLQSGQQINEMVKVIYNENFQSLSRYIMQNGGSWQDAEDIFQEVVVNFIELVQKNKFRGESSLKTFLFSINRHIWLNELKKRGRAQRRENKYEKGQEVAEIDASQYIADREEKATVAALVGTLDETCKKILLLFYYENLSIKEILETTNYENEQVVRNKKYKCLKQLEQILNEKPNLKQTLKDISYG